MGNLFPDKELINVSNSIDLNIDYYFEDRQLLSINILQVLRTLTEDVALLTYNKLKNCNLDCFYENKKTAISFVKGLAKLRSVNKLYKYVEASASHYVPDGINSERLLLKYYMLLVDIKEYVYNEFDINILNNLYKYPLNTDKTFFDYYDKVASKIEQVGLYGSNYIKGRYYVERIKPFKSKDNIYYEVTLTKAIDNPSKFDRIIAFTKLKMLENYSIKVSFTNAKINVFEGDVSIKIINNWLVNIRPCEIYNFAKIFGKAFTIKADYYEYRTLMNYLTNNLIDVLDIVLLDESYFEEVINIVKNGKEEGYISELLRNTRKVVINRKYGSNIIMYLSYIMNNRVIKNQLLSNENPKINNLHLDYGCMMFEDLPFFMRLKSHNPDIDDLIMSLSLEDKEDELLARYIKNNTEYNNKLYTPIQELENYEDLESLINVFNNKLYYTAANSKIINKNSYLYIKEYEDKTVNILKKLLYFAENGIDRYTLSMNFYTDLEPNLIYEENKEIIKNLFDKSSVYIVYGSAGTGKTTLIGDYCKLYNCDKTLLLANTYSAVENLKRKVGTNNNFTFKVVRSYLGNRNTDYNFKTIIIDESSTVTNSDMFDIVNKSNFNKLLIVGDTCQIGSILYGNWFNLACQLMPEHSKFYLADTRRTTNSNLLEFWSKVRDGDDKITEFLSKTDFVCELNNTIFDSYDDDEIILCLNYNGLYGINNINKYMQDMNNERGIEIGINTYKINDPIIFEDNNRYKDCLYNNLKGWIKDIEELNDYVIFTIEIDDILNKVSAMYSNVEIVEEYDNKHSLIKLTINKFDDSDEDDNGDGNDIVPFNVSYAVSIHKAQGLEYNSVKVILSNDIQELITKDIFYTAITRAKEKLHIYWTSETQNRIIANLNNRELNLDKEIVKNKLYQ